MKNRHIFIIALFVIIEIGAIFTFAQGEMSIVSFALISLSATLGIIAQKLSLKKKNITTKSIRSSSK